MAHLIILRYSSSFVEGKDLVYGTHEAIEREIAKRKYPLTLDREGYCIPDCGEWKLLEYRVKKEVLPDFVRDLKGLILNPQNNNITLWKIFRAKKSTMIGKNRMPNKQIMFLQWCFKWANKLGVSPYKPVPINLDKKVDSFVPKYGYAYHIILGIRDDPTEILWDGSKHEDTM